MNKLLRFVNTSALILFVLACGGLFAGKVDAQDPRQEEIDLALLLIEQCRRLESEAVTPGVIEIAPHCVYTTADALYASQPERYRTANWYVHVALTRAREAGNKPDEEMVLEAEDTIRQIRQIVDR